MSHKQITIIGPIASGKTTASQFLSNHLHLPLLDADLYETNPFLPSYIEDTARWSFITELFFTTKRIKKLSTLPKLLQKSSVVVDSGLIMSHEVYTKNHLVGGTMTASEWEFFSSLVADFKQDIPDPDIIIYLTCNPRVQLERISARGRTFESGYTLPYLASITDRIGEYIESISNNKQITLLTFDSEKYDMTQSSGQTELLNMLKPVLDLS